MAKGYVYIMTTAVDGIIKIGKSNNWNRRCQDELEQNGYRNMNSLKTYFVVETSNYSELENIMHDIFREGRVITSDGCKTELFACDKNRAKKVLAQMGKEVYPSDTKTTAQKTTQPKEYQPKKSRLTFEMLDIPIGSELVYILDPTIKVYTVDNVSTVSYNGKNYSISGLAGQLKGYSTIQGGLYFTYNGIKLTDLRTMKESQNN